MPRNPEIRGVPTEKSRFRKQTTGRPTVFVSGSWQPDRAFSISPEAYKLGKLIAEAGYDLSIGPGTGVARYVIDGYHSVEKRGHVIFYLPSESEMERVGEKMEEGADETIQTGLDYPKRNLVQVWEADALVAIGGSSGTVTEIIAAALDYGKPTIVFKTGEAYNAVKKLTDMKDKIKYVSKAKGAVETVRRHLRKAA